MAVIRILGIDPGLAITGYGLIEKDGAKLAYIASGRIRSKDTEPLPSRLASILAGLAEVIAGFNPVEVAVEEVFVNVNPRPCSRSCPWPSTPPCR